MFYDERIENVKGKISRNAIFMSFVISLVLGIIHLANIIRNSHSNKHFWFVSLEIAICVSTLIVLTIGFILRKLNEKDERADLIKNAFYNKASSILISQKHSLLLMYFLSRFQEVLLRAKYCSLISFFLIQKRKFLLYKL